MTEEVYLAAGNRTTNQRYHTDKTCERLNRAPRMHEVALSEIQDRRSQCQVCLGMDRGEGNYQSGKYAQALEDADPDTEWSEVVEYVND